jgi:hypothetical protein
VQSWQLPTLEIWLLLWYTSHTAPILQPICEWFRARPWQRLVFGCKHSPALGLCPPGCQIFRCLLTRPLAGNAGTRMLRGVDQTNVKSAFATYRMRGFPFCYPCLYRFTCSECTGRLVSFSILQVKFIWFLDQDEKSFSQAIWIVTVTRNCVGLDANMISTKTMKYGCIRHLRTLRKTWFHSQATGAHPVFLGLASSFQRDIAAPKRQRNLEAMRDIVVAPTRRRGVLASPGADAPFNTTVHRRMWASGIASTHRAKIAEAEMIWAPRSTSSRNPAADGNVKSHLPGA